MSTFEEYLAGLDASRRADVRALDELIRTTTPQLEPTMTSGLPGYGSFRYRYSSGREGVAALLSIASNKTYISLYVNAVRDDHYVAEAGGRGTSDPRAW